jgi:hypothetical protein
MNQTCYEEPMPTLPQMLRCAKDNLATAERNRDTGVKYSLLVPGSANWVHTHENIRCLKGIVELLRMKAEAPTPGRHFTG